MKDLNWISDEYENEASTAELVRDLRDYIAGITDRYLDLSLIKLLYMKELIDIMTTNESKKVYIAGPLFSKSELDFNLELNNFLGEIGFNTFLPQVDGHLLSELIKNGYGKEDALKLIFQKDLEEIKNSDIVVFIMDGRVPDEGACVEIGLAFAYGKECFGLKTDSRTLLDNMDNPLITGAVKGRIAKSFSELESFLKL